MQMVSCEKLGQEVAQLLSVQVSIVVLIKLLEVVAKHFLEVVIVFTVVPKLVEDILKFPFLKFSRINH